MADTKISGLTTDAAPHRTNDFAPTYDASAVATKKVALKHFGLIVFHGGFSSTNPADASTYYFGNFPQDGLTGTAASYPWYMPRAGIITGITVRMVITGAGSAETSTLSIRLNNTTDTAVTAAIALNANFLQTYPLSISVANLDFIEMKWATPTWSTNPTGVRGGVLIHLE